jgi:hypothetical protein
MKTKLLMMVLFTGLIFCACKKEDKQPSPPTNSGGGGGGGGSNYPASNASAFSGIFTTGDYVGSVKVGSTTYTFNANEAWAYFSNSPQPYIDVSTSVLVNKVYLNGDTVPYNPSYHYYATTNTVSLASETWSVNGANGIGTFTIANNFTTPSASGYLSFPDSISLATGFTVSINNVNASSASIFISDGGSGSYAVNLQSGNNTLTVSPTNLTGVSTSTGGSIALLLSNKKAFTILSKDYQFNREFQYTKSIKIKP